MNIGIIGGIIGVVAALAAIFVAVYATGAMEYQGGRKKPRGESVGRETLLEQSA